MIARNEKYKWVKDDFDRIAVNGYLGDPDGEIGMAYLRVSSSGQAEEGRTGFPRQLLHVAEKARQLHLAIPWQLVFFDDHTGFEFRDRPALTELRALVKSSQRSSDHLVIENLDRLSREASWHQGFLIDEFEKDGKVKIHFWKELGSRIERAVYGTVAEDRMRTDLERMAAGNRIKAQSGRVTARVAAYGYKLVDSTGGTANAKKDTHYALFESQARVVRMIYQWILTEHATLGDISARLTTAGIAPPKRSRTWEPSLLLKMVANPVYKGEFYAHRSMEVKRISRLTGKEVKIKVLRPRNEWILVQVPAIVSATEWDAARAIVRNNRTQSLRNTKREYLLINITECAKCKSKMTSGCRYHYKNTRAGAKTYVSQFYRCSGRGRREHIREIAGITCDMSQISSRRIDQMVWETVLKVLLNREQLEAALDRYFSRFSRESTLDEISYIQSNISALETEDELLYRAYISKAFDADEFARRRYVLKEQIGKLEDEKDELQRKRLTQMGRQEKKAAIINMADDLHQRADKDIPFAVKRQILLIVVDKITLNTQEEWFELEGAIAGRFDFSPFDSTSADRGSWPQLVGNWREKSVCRWRG